MKTLNELERAKKDRIKQLSADEVERYINKLHKEMAEAWGTIDNGFNIDAATMIKNSALCDEAVEILNDKYLMELLVATSRSNTLVEKHLADIEDMRNFMLETGMEGIICNFWQTSHNILILTQFLNILYEHYWISPADIESYLDNTDAAEEDKAAVLEEVDMEKIPVYSLYQQHFMDSVELNIKHMVRIIDAEMIFLKQLIKNPYEKKDKAAGTYHDTFRKDMIKYQKLTQELIADYEDLKQDGFKNAKEIEAEILSKALDKDVDFFSDMFKSSRPSYDVNNFIFIPPQNHIESMRKFHPDWKYDGPTAADDDYEDEGIDVWYATVTNPIIK